MKVLLLNQFFPPDLAPTGQMAADLAEDLVAAGAEVTALTSRGTYLGGGNLPRRERWRGIDIVRVTATSLGKRTLLHRAADYASFYVTASAALVKLPRHDVVVALTTPPLIAATGLFAKALKGSRLVYWVQDLYPEVAVAFGALGPRSLPTQLMAATSRMVMRRADAVVALGEEMRLKCMAAGAPADRAVSIPNWADEAVVRPIAHDRNALRAELARGARTVVMYSGNMGRAHDIGTLLRAARLLVDRTDVVFVFVGDGEKRREVEAAARELPNVRLAPYAPRDQLAESLSAGDLHLIALSPEIEGLIEPSKLYGIMAAGRPSLYVGPRKSEVARTIARERCGIVVENGNAPGLATGIASLASDDAARTEMGKRARSALEERHGRRVATSRFREVLVSVSAGGAPCPTITG